jgi:hypothetical protein
MRESYSQKIQAMMCEVFLISYVNNVESKIDESNLICAPDMFPFLKPTKNYV